MPFHIGPLELVIILLIVIALFGAGRIAGIGRALGQSVREFRTEARPGDEKDGKDAKAAKDAGTAKAGTTDLKSDATAASETTAEAKKE
ncbi:MAG: twin-arginine translocase TatA/TatE family subunit [Actinobacteria bacterium]|nr:twin-arginine translocase TatA/TatE family subunit [Actinomycetota bacterium]